MSTYRVPSPTSSAHSLDSLLTQESSAYFSASEFLMSDMPSSQPLGLTQDQIQQLLSFLNSNSAAAPKTLKPAPAGNKAVSKWPVWNGAKELYSLYIDQLVTKIETDWNSLGGHRAVCSDMISTIPDEYKSRVSHWFSTGGPDRDWDYQQFIKHFNDQFEDKTSTRAASESLAMMRQGQYQAFTDYLNDFEYTLAQAQGSNWEGRVKINYLTIGLNDRLSKALVHVTTSEVNYTLFIKQVREVAGKLEARDHRSPKRSTTQSKTWYINKATEPSQSYHHNTSSVSGTTPSPMQTVDAEGDTQMSGINGISAATLFAIVNAVNSQAEGTGKRKINKPPAPWRSKEDHAALIAAGKCTRCGEKGHWFKKCPRFTWPNRPINVNHTSFRGAEGSGEVFYDDGEELNSGKE